MPRETTRRREQKVAAFAVKAGLAERRPLSQDEATALFHAIDEKDAAGFGIRRLSTLDLDGLHEAPDCIPWEPRVSLLYYAAWRRRDHFINALLRAGANPAARGGACAHCSQPDAAAVRDYVGALRPELAAWVLRTLVRLRHAGALAVQRPGGSRGACAGGCGAASPGSGEATGICQPLAWQPCGHLCCEPCWWRHCLSLEHAAGAPLACPACGVQPQEADSSAAGRAERLNKLSKEEKAKLGVVAGTDWTCEKCTYSNFARRMDCRNCGALRKEARLAEQAEAEAEAACLAGSEKPGPDESTVTAEQRRLLSLVRWEALPPDRHEALLPVKAEKFRAMSATDAAASRLGHTRHDRSAELFKAAVAGDTPRLLALLRAGTDVREANEYGQTPLFLAAYHGHGAAARLLAEWGGQPGCAAAGGTTPAAAAAAGGYGELASWLRDLAGEAPAPPVEMMGLENLGSSAPQATLATLIPRDSPLAGAGSYLIDGAFGEAFLRRLESLFEGLPVAAAQKDSPNDRSYYCDAEHWVEQAFRGALVAAGAAAAGVPVDAPMAQMRFLHYRHVGGGLPPHVDLSRTDLAGRRSTHTFILYLADCTEGGETVLLSRVAEDRAAYVAEVKPRRGRLLLLPHVCPHMARPTLEVPKLLLRGEMYLSSAGGGSSAAAAASAAAAPPRVAGAAVGHTAMSKARSVPCCFG